MAKKGIKELDEIRVMFVKNWMDSETGVFHKKGSFCIVTKEKYEKLMHFKLIQG